MDIKQLAKFDKLVKAKKQEIEALRAGMLNSSNYQNQKVKQSKKNTVEEMTIKRIDKIRQLEADLAQLYDTYSALSASIDVIPDPMASLILRLKYINGYSWPMIKRTMPNYSQSRLYDYHKKGLAELEAIYGACGALDD